jgi:Cdc6-like AAA superfamily ATPase
MAAQAGIGEADAAIMPGAELFEASLPEAAALLLRRCFMASQAVASNLLIAVMKRLFPSDSPPHTDTDSISDTPGPLWFEQLKEAVDDNCRRYVLEKPDGPWDIYIVFDALRNMLPRLLESSASTSLEHPTHVLADEEFMHHVDCVYNSRNWWAHRPVSIEQACTAAESLRYTLTQLHDMENLMLDSDKKGIDECSLAVDVTLQQLRSHSTVFCDWQVDDVAFVMLLRSFQHLCKSAHPMILDCRKSEVDIDHVKYCYSCREQLCKCTQLKAKDVKNGHAKDAVKKHLTDPSGACVKTCAQTCAQLVQNCLHDVIPLVCHMKYCRKCLTSGADRDVDLLIAVRNLMFHGSKQQELVSLVLSTLLSVESLMGKMKCDKHDGLAECQKMRTQMQKFVKFPDVLTLIGTAAAAIRPQIASCSSLPDYSLLNDLDVVKFVLFGSVPLPTSGCDCFKILGQVAKNLGIVQVTNNLGIVKAKMKEPQFVSGDAYSEVQGHLTHCSKSLDNVSQKLNDSFTFNAANLPKTKPNHEKDLKFCEALANISGTVTPTAVPSSVCHIAKLLKDAGECLSKVHFPPDAGLCLIAQNLVSTGQFWLLLQHVIFSDKKEIVYPATCTCVVQQNCEDARLYYVKEKLKASMNMTDSSEVNTISNASVHLEELALVYGAKSTLTKTSVVVEVLDSSVYSKFLPIKEDSLLVARDLVQRCCSGMWKAITTPGKRQLQLLVGDPGVGKTCTAAAAIHQLQRLAMDPKHSKRVLVHHIRGHSAADVDTEFVQFGRALSRRLRLEEGMTEEQITAKLIDHLKEQSYAIFADDVKEEALLRIIERLPVSSEGCVIIATSRYIAMEDGERIFGSHHDFCSEDLVKVTCFTPIEAKKCLENCRVHASFLSHPDLPELMDKLLGHLPLAIRIFASWLSNQDEASGAHAALTRWKAEQDLVLRQGTPEHIRTLVATMRLALYDLEQKSNSFQWHCSMHVLEILTLCDSATPLSMFKNWKLLESLENKDICLLLKHMQKCTGILHFDKTDGADEFNEVDMHTLVRDSLKSECLSSARERIDPDIIVGLLEQHFLDSDLFHSVQNFAFLRTILSSCDSVLKSFVKKFDSFVKGQQDASDRILSLQIQICRVSIRMHSSCHYENSMRGSHYGDSERLYDLQYQIFKRGCTMQTEREKKPLIIKKSVPSFAEESTERACFVYHLVEYESLSNSFRIKGSDLRLRVSPDPDLSFLFPDDSIWRLFSKLCEEFHGLSCRYRVVSYHFSILLDIFLYSSDTLLSMKSLIASHAQFHAQQIPQNVAFFHNGRQIVGDIDQDEYSLVGLGILKNSLILIEELPSSNENLSILRFLKLSQQLQHAYKLCIEAAALHGHNGESILCSRDAISFIKSFEPTVTVTDADFVPLPDSNSSEVLTDSSVSEFGGIYEAAVKNRRTVWSEQLSEAVPPSVESISEKEQKQRILSGQLCIDDTMFKFSNQRFLRIYFSANVSDFKFERDFLQQHFVPFLQQSCISRGFRCIFNDMHHGPFLSKIADEHGSGAILKELEKCQSESAGIAYVAFAGKSEGVTLIPDSIPVADYEKCLKQVREAKREANSEDKEIELDVLKTWFVQDSNTTPSHPCCVLQPGLNDEIHEDARKKLMSLLDSYSWHSNLMSCELGLASKDKSVVILKCEPVQRNNTQPSEVLQSVMQDDVSGGFAESSDTGLPDEDTVTSTFRSRHKLESEQRNAESDEICMAIKRIQLGGDEREYLNAVIHECCEPIIESLISAFRRTSSFSDDLFMECLFHRNFAIERASKFCDDIQSIQGVLGAINAFFDQSETHICTLHGRSGSGKTCIMAQSIKNLQSKDPDAVVIFRFIGASPRTSQSITLLYDICSQLNHLSLHPGIETSNSNIPIDKDNIRDYFIKLIHRVGQQRRLVFVLDSLDQLKSDNDDACPFWWLPQCRELNSPVRGETNPSVHFLISSVSSVSETHDFVGSDTAYIDQLCAYLSEGSIATSIAKIQISPISEASDLKRMFRHILNSHSSGRRRTSDKQTDFVVEFLETFPNSQYPLFLSIIAQNALSWHSYFNDPNPILPNASHGVRGIIQFELCRLESKFGFEFTSAALSFLSLAVEGISELELSELLCRDDDVLAEVLTKIENTPIAGGLPTILVSMLIDSIKLFLTRRSVRDQELLSWYHRQFVETCRVRYCLINDDGHNTFFNKRSSQLADFFTGKWSEDSKPVDAEDNSLWLVERVCALGLQHKIDRRTRPQPFCFGYPDGVLSFFQFCGGVEGLNHRRCTETVHHMIGSARYVDAIEELCRFDGISARIHCGEHFTMMMHFFRVQVLLKKHDVQQSLKDKSIVDMQTTIDHFKCWLDSSLEFILQKPRLHTLVSCSRQPDLSIARKQMLELFKCDSFMPLNYLDKQKSISNLLLFCPRASNFDGNFMTFRYQRRSVICVALSEKFTAVVFSKASVGKNRHHAVEIRSNTHSSVVHSFLLSVVAAAISGDDCVEASEANAHELRPRVDAANVSAEARYKKISASWSIDNSDNNWLAVTCIHRNPEHSCIYMWDSVSKNHKPLPFPYLSCASWGKPMNSRNLLIASSRIPSTGGNEIRIFEFDSLSASFTFTQYLEFKDCIGDDRQICRMKQVVGCDLISTSPLRVVLWGATIEYPDSHKVFYLSQSPIPGQHEHLPTEVQIDDSIHARKNGDVFCVCFNHDVSKMMIACTNGISVYRFSEKDLKPVELVNSRFYWDSSADSVHFMNVPLKRSSGTVFETVFFKLRYPSNDAARLSIWCESEPNSSEPKFVLHQTFVLNENFSGHCFSSGHVWFSTLVEEESCSYITLCDVRTRLFLEPAVTSQQNGCLSEANVTRLCWNQESSIVASVGKASSPLHSDFVDCWKWGFWQSQPVLSHMKSRIMIGEGKHLKSVHWMPDGKLAVIWVSHYWPQLDLYTIYPSGQEHQKDDRSWTFKIDDFRFSSLSPCEKYLALAGTSKDISTILIYCISCENSKIFQEDQGFVKPSFQHRCPKSSIICMEWCASMQPRLIILSQKNQGMQKYLHSLDVSSSDQDFQCTLLRTQVLEESQMCQSHSFSLKCSPDGKLIALSCSSNSLSSIIFILCCNTGQLLHTVRSEVLVNDMSWHYKTCGAVSKYILATGNASRESTSTPPLAYVFSREQSAILKLDCESPLWDPKEIAVSLKIHQLAFSPNGKILVAASSTESLQMFVNVNFSNQTPELSSAPRRQSFLNLEKVEREET